MTYFTTLRLIAEKGIFEISSRVHLVSRFFRHKFISKPMRIVGDLEEFTSFDKFCILALHPQKSFTYIESLKNMISGLASEGIAIMFVVNGNNKYFSVEDIAPKGSLICFRPNIGRDFGAYQAGYVSFMEIMKSINFQSVIFANDTLYYFTPPSKLLRFLTKQTWGALYMNLENHTHAQSFLFSVSSEVMFDDKFRKFWKNYIPSDIRRHAIHRGEIQLSSDLIRSGFRCNPFVDTKYIQAIVTEKADALPSEIQAITSLPVAPLMGDSRYEFDLRKWAPRQAIRREYQEQKIDANTIEDLVGCLIKYVHSDPPHRIGPHLSLLGNLPLKKDLFKYFALDKILEIENLLPKAREMKFAEDQQARLQAFMVGDTRGKKTRHLGEV